MAVAGLQNVSAYGRSFFGESQSPRSRRWGDERARPSTRASSILQMWRELEAEHVVAREQSSSPRRNNSDTESLVSSISMDNGQEDNNSVISEQSSYLGDNERERVGQIFREWMNSGDAGRSSNSNSCSGPQWLGENECERVRIIREWVQKNSSQQRNSQGLNGDGVPEIEQMRDGLVVGQREIGARRPIRRLCGRQTLLDLLSRAQCERKGEIQHLSEQRPVSDFPHRNRIQALLRGRFLRNERLIPDKRPSSVAATELGLLRQRQTVSDLREGFLSKLDNSASISVKSTESDSSSTDENNDEPDSTCIEREETANFAPSDLETAVNGNSGQQESVVQATEVEDPVRGSVENTQEGSLNNIRRVQEVSSNVLDTETSEQMNATITIESTVETLYVNINGSTEVFQEPAITETYVNEVIDHNSNLEGNANHEFDWQDDSTRMEELQESETEIEDSSWQELARNWHESTSGQWFQETSDDAAVEQDQIHESHEEWTSHDLQEAIDSWLDMPSGEVGASAGSVRSFYFPDDDDNAHNIEIRELFSRRRVSSLLRSSFRDSLNQVLQSHVERQVHHASDDWEMENETSLPNMVERDQEQPNGDRTLNVSDDADINLYTPASTVVTAFQPHWDEELPGGNLPHLNQQMGTEWEVINELRIDMARLQQRMNNMQSMLEACMDMQIELQRSVRQEVSAALNRTILTRDADAPKGNMVCDESQWDHVKKGICCLCRDSKINSLLYRCGHMCTCSECAEKLVQCMAKCPMCCAPVVEAVRAYFTQL